MKQMEDYSLSEESINNLKIIYKKIMMHLTIRCLERAGSEPSTSTLQGCALPLSYARNIFSTTTIVS